MMKVRCIVSRKKKKQQEKGVVAWQGQLLGSSPDQESIVEPVAPVEDVVPVKIVRHDRSKVVFSPYAWAKLLWFRYRGESEVSGFGISSVADPLYVTDFMTVPQTVTGVTTEMDDVGVADFFEDMHEKGLQPCEYGRIWIHTHPGMGVVPSSVDEKCFGGVFGGCDWAVMMILGGNKSKQETSCRLGFNVGPGVAVMLKTEVDWEVEFVGADHAVWEQEYTQTVKQGVSYGGMYGVGMDYATGKGASDTYGADDVGTGVDDLEYDQLWRRAMDGDALAISELTSLSCSEVETMKALGFDGGQICWYDTELCGMSDPDELDPWIEEQRTACNSGYGDIGNVGYGGVDVDGKDGDYTFRY